MTDLDFSYNTVNASTIYFEIGRYFDDLLPNQRETIIDVPKVQGYTQLLKKFEPREIQTIGVLYANDNAQLNTRIEGFADYLYKDSDKPLIFNDKPHKFYYAQFLEKVRTEKRGGGILAAYQLNMRANDPLGYAVTPDISTQLNKTKGYYWDITNTGQYYSWPTITITLNQNQSHIYVANNTLTEARIDISKAFTAGQVLKIDTKLIRVLLNNIYSPAGLGDGGLGLYAMPILKTGVNEFEIGTDNATLNASIVVNYRKTYL